MNRYAKVKEILDTLVQGRNIGAHGAFWRGLSRDQFVAHRVFGYPLVTVGNGSTSNLIKALTGQAPFGQDIGTPGGFMRRMPAAGLPPARPEDIAFIQKWIDDGCPEDLALAALDSSTHNAYWRDFDNWAMFHATPDVEAAIGEFFPRVEIWFGAVRGTATVQQWQTAISQPAARQAIALLSGLQRQTVIRHYGQPIRAAEVLESYALFGDGSLPSDPLRPEDPNHKMNGREMWFYWSACADACIRLAIDTDFWPLHTRAVLLGLLHDGLFRGRFTVSGFTPDAAGRAAMLTHVAGLQNAALLDELARRLRESQILA